MPTEDKDALVSIIVPVYNVGAFARPCIESLLSQTYKNIEVLVIDDGSTDDTVEVVRAAASDDPRLRVLNKENGGLSSARNFGTARCTGDYIMYVDGDDLISSETVELMVAAAKKYEVPLAVAAFAKTAPLERYVLKQGVSFALESGEERLRKMLLLDGESGSACGKLYARSLVPLLDYPEGQLFEDLGVTAKVFSQVDRSAVTEAPLYAYVTRPNSITTLKKQGQKHIDDMNRAIEQVCAANGEKFVNEFECFRAYCTLRVAMRIDLDNFEDREFGLSYLRRACEYSRAAAKNSLASRTWRVRCALFSISPTLHNVLYSLYGHISGKTVG